MQAFESLGMGHTINAIHLYALLNESTKEHGFAKHKQRGQYRHPTKKQYVQSKGRHEIETIKKTCECPHAYHTNTFTAYQPTHASNLASPAVVSEYDKWSQQFHPKDAAPTAAMKKDLKKARMLNVLTKANPTQNIRDLYRYKCGYGPCVIFQKDAHLEDGDAVSRYYPDFERLMEELAVRRGEHSSSRRLERGDYLFLPGDILVINPGVNDSIPSGDKWWLLQVNKAHHSSKTGNACLVYGFWLDEQPQSEGDSDCRVFSLMSDAVKLYFGSVIKNAGTPLVIPANEIVTGRRDGKVSYVFSNEYCFRLDNLSDQHRLSLETNVSDQEESDSASDDESDDDGNRAADHSMELMLMARRRVIRNSEGNQLASYKDLAGISNRSGGRRESRRQVFVADHDELISANRDDHEFNLSD